MGPRRSGPAVGLALIFAASTVLGADARAMDATPLCSATTFAELRTALAAVPRRLSSDFRLPRRDRPRGGDAPLPEIFRRRFAVLEKALFGKTGVLRITATKGDAELGIQFNRDFGVTANTSFIAETLQLSGRAADVTELVDLILAHELGHLVQDLYSEVDHRRLALRAEGEGFRLPEPAKAILATKKRDLEKLKGVEREVAEGAIEHAETTFIGLAILAAAGIRLSPAVADDLERLRRTYAHRHPAAGVPATLVDIVNDVEFAFLRCSITAANAPRP